MRSLDGRLAKLENTIGGREKPSEARYLIVLHSCADNEANNAEVRRHGFDPADPSVLVTAVCVTLVSPCGATEPYYPEPKFVSATDLLNKRPVECRV